MPLPHFTRSTAQNTYSPCLETIVPASEHAEVPKKLQIILCNLQNPRTLSPIIHREDRTVDDKKQAQ